MAEEVELSLEISHEEEVLSAQKKEKKGEEVSAKVWMTVSLCVGVLYAWANICIVENAKYKVKAVGMTAIGATVGNLGPLVWI